MKVVSVLFSILIILSLWIPFAASGLPSGTAKVVSAGLNNQASQAGNPALLGTAIQQKALESEISHPTPFLGVIPATHQVKVKADPVKVKWDQIKGKQEPQPSSGQYLSHHIQARIIKLREMITSGLICPKGECST